MKLVVEIGPRRPSLGCHFQYPKRGDVFKIFSQLLPAALSSQVIEHFSFLASHFVVQTF
jgi:hypothetical protein